VAASPAVDRPAPLSATTVLEPALAADPGAEAVVGRSGRLTYRELDDLAERSRRALWAAGVRPGDRVAVSLPNDLPIVALFHGAMRLGAVWVGVNRQLAPPEKRYMVDDSGTAVFLGDDDMVAQLAAAAPALRRITLAGPEWADLLGAGPTGDEGWTPDPLAPAAIAYTSGTTGFPKGAVHSQHNLMLPGAVLVQSRGYGPALRKADCFPLTILNLQVLSTLLVPQAGGTAVVMDRVDAPGIAEWLRTERATLFNGAPAMLHALASDDAVVPADLRSVEEVWSGGSSLPEAVRARFATKFGCGVHTTYGLTEAPTVVTIMSRGDTDHPGSSGTALPHLTVAIRGPSGEVLGERDTGEICVEGVPDGPWAGAYRPMLGYWGRPETGAATVRDGRLHTGDLGSLGPAGHLSVAERQSAVIQRGSANVYPGEVERVIDQLDGVTASCVVGVADERLGERVVALVEPAAGAELTADALGAHCAAHLARYKVPERFLFGPLPRNSMGKVIRREVEATMATGSGLRAR
jgi:O-succinylbenzoic acid--CoA ligase